jgi:peptidoglycan LD-endopeptidase CwlK
MNELPLLKQQYLGGVEVPETWDKYTNYRLKNLHPYIRINFAKAVNECEKIGYKLRLTDDGNLRTFDQQDQLFGYSRTSSQLNNLGINVVYAKPNETWRTNAYGGQSYHNYGLATDVCIIVGNKADFNINTDIAVILNKYGFEWLYEKIKKDKPHFQLTFGYTIDDLFEMHNEKRFIKNTKYLDL